MGKRAKRVEPYAWTRNLLALLKNKGSVRVLVCLAAGARTFSALESETGLDASTLYKRLCTLLDFRQVEKRNTVARNFRVFPHARRRGYRAIHQIPGISHLESDPP